MFVSPYNEGIILVLAQRDRFQSRPQVNGGARERIPEIRHKSQRGIQNVRQKTHKTSPHSFAAGAYTNEYLSNRTSSLTLS